MRLVLLLCLFCLAPSAWAQEGSLERDLESVYTNWRQATAAKDLASWKKWTAPQRQALTRNLLISQRRRYPEGMFASDAVPPALAGLRLLSARAKGPTATAVYHGKVGDAGDSCLILRFFRDGQGWKYDSLSVAKLPAQAQQDIRAGKLAFLNELEFSPSGELPLTSKPCPVPDYVADVHVVALGFKAAVEINGISHHLMDNNAGTELVIGGLRKGANKVSIRTKPLAVAGGDQRVVKVTVYAKTGNRAKPAVKVFEFAPQEVPAALQAEFTVDPAALAADR